MAACELSDSEPLENRAHFSRSCLLGHGIRPIVRALPIRTAFSTETGNVQSIIPTWGTWQRRSEVCSASLNDRRRDVPTEIWRQTDECAQKRSFATAAGA
jgi:hypothetical protein